MVDSQSLTVGLAVGIPSFVIISVVLLLWLRNQRKQKKEDSVNDDIDMDLRDDQSFNQFQEELHRPYAKGKAELNINTYSDPNKSSSTTQGESSTEKPYISSHGSTSSSNIIDQPHVYATPPRPKYSNANNGTNNVNNNNINNLNNNLNNNINNTNNIHSKSPSAYDFYETFIPILPGGGSPSTNNGNTAHHSNANSVHEAHSNGNLQSQLQQPPHIHDVASTNNSSNDSLNGNDRSSLDNLAKQLTSPVFFEKLPSRATTVALKPRFPNMQSNNSSSEGLNNRLIGDTTALNDNFIYEAPTVDVKKTELQAKDFQRSHLSREQTVKSHEDDVSSISASHAEDVDSLVEPDVSRSSNDDEFVSDIDTTAS
ncbi:predicted protein [Scheffersomyces stipitis CBS 6054]|uniref:Suppressor of lethality of KEX2 GAS1 double null mutant protein 1 n=1 Tax=Scheffersomyces stipitis (strain ATCC 58785 / CBS 6054 / NBRC 10063 / NRRL Y-11545) TaxID=322104 RepID=A3LYN9_PICST|nr:predicted protein [Scheffersomyces stipitis CBS 6054]ABN68006.2 predicted protein [Scheffersomyces stipitis CBS 6054]